MSVYRPEGENQTAGRPAPKSESRNDHFIQGRTTLRPEGFYPPTAGDRPTQGQLLTGGHRHPWPKGFSDRRFNEVADAIQDHTPVVATMVPDTKEVGKAWHRRRGDDPTKARQALDDARARIGGVNNQRAFITIAEHIARSSAAPDATAGIDSIQVGPDAAPGAGAYYSVTKGEPWRAEGESRHPRAPKGHTAELSINAESVDELRSDQHATALYHELGHHESRIAQNPHSLHKWIQGQTRTSVDVGAEEAEADLHARKIAPEGMMGDKPISGYEQGSVDTATLRKDYQSSMDPVTGTLMAKGLMKRPSELFRDAYRDRRVKARNTTGVEDMPVSYPPSQQRLFY